MVKIGIIGKPSSGKSTFFSAATMVDVPRAAYPFTTIKPNIGVTYVTRECAHIGLGVKCSPNNSRCEDGTRLIPMTLVDVAGLVPDAHLGKGMGNQFLSDLMEANGLIHVVDLSGKTDERGEECEGHDPEKDIIFLEREIDFWIEGMLGKKWPEFERKSKMGYRLYELVHRQMSGLGMSENQVRDAIERGYDDLYDLAKKMRERSKPIILAGNKIDLKGSLENYDRLKADYDITPVCSEAELALRKADHEGLIRYIPGSDSFEHTGDMDGKQRQALDYIQRNILDVYGGTGVQQLLNRMSFGLLEMIAVYPVEDKTRLSSKDGKVLPDVFLMKRGSTAIDLAYRVHSDIGDRFIGAFDCRKKIKISRDHPLQDGDVVQILARP